MQISSLRLFCTFSIWAQVWGEYQKLHNPGNPATSDLSDWLLTWWRKYWKHREDHVLRLYPCFQHNKAITAKGNLEGAGVECHLSSWTINYTTNRSWCMMCAHLQHGGPTGCSVLFFFLHLQEFSDDTTTMGRVLEGSTGSRSTRGSSQTGVISTTMNARMKEIVDHESIYYLIIISLNNFTYLNFT